jgi:peptidoglycan/xylan/chitin deacetylase (PgdA/CDA1 family)
MRFYPVKTPDLIKFVFPTLIWAGQPANKTIYLSFDDGPDPRFTPFILDQLKHWSATATFFCLGKNVAAHPELYQQILAAGHHVGNHTYHHLNGWKTSATEYLKDIEMAATYIHSDLFRPPYGKITLKQIRNLHRKAGNYRIIMWTVLSGDFDKRLSGKNCFKIVISNSKPGAIIVFHDSEKAWERMSYALPRVLEYFSNNGFSCQALPRDFST